MYIELFIYSKLRRAHFRNTYGSRRVFKQFLFLTELSQNGINRNQTDLFQLIIYLSLSE